MTEYVLKCPTEPLERKELLTIANLRRGHDYKAAINLLSSLPEYLIEDDKVIDHDKLIPFLKSLQISGKHVWNIDTALQNIIDIRFPSEFMVGEVISDLSDMLGIKYGAYPQPEIETNGNLPIKSYSEIIYMQLYNQLRNSQHSCSQHFKPKISLSVTEHKLEKNELGYIGNNQFLAGTPFVRIDVSDNGVGIDDELLPEIFKRGVTTKMTRGIGLALSGQTCYLLQGFLKVNTQLLKGTTFSLYLPQEI